MWPRPGRARGHRGGGGHTRAREAAPAPRGTSAVSTNLFHLQPRPGAGIVDPREPLDEAVLEVSARLASNNSERRRLYSRLDELRSADPSLRRRRPRVLPLDPLRPLTFYSIEEAGRE